MYNLSHICLRIKDIIIQCLQQMIKQHWKTKQREAISGAIKTKGYLLKKSNSILGNYQKRFFIINNDYLVYYKDQTLDSLKNKINLISITQIQSIGELQFTFYSKTKNKKYQIKAESKNQRDQWVSSLIVIEEYLSYTNRKTINEIKEPQEESGLEATIRTTLKVLNLQQLSKQYHEDYIKCRIIGHLTTKGCLFLVSCKSLVKEIKDEIILDKEYIEPKQFNVLYLFDTKTSTCERVINSEEIEEVVLIARTLRINNIRINIEEEKDESHTHRFIERLKNSKSIGEQIRNKKGIILRQNIDYLVQLFQKRQDRLQQQHIQIKLQDEYIGLMVNHQRDYKRNFAKFKALIKKLRTQMQDTLNAIELKKSNLKELSILYVNFYYEKIYKLLKQYWTENYDTMKIGEIINLTQMSLNFHNTISKYVSDGSLLINGAVLLRDIYLKKLIAEIELSLKDLVKNQQIFVLSKDKNTTCLPNEFVRVVRWKVKVIEENCEIEIVRKQSEILLIEAAVLLIINILENKMELMKYKKQLLMILCNDSEKYLSHMKQAFPLLDLTQIKVSFNEFQSNIIKRLHIHYLSQQPISYSVIQTEFLKVNMERYVDFANKQLSKLEYLSPNSIKEIQNSLGQNFNTYYYRSLVNSCSKTVVFQSAVEEMIAKIKSDCSSVKNVFSKSNVEKVECLLKNLICLLSENNSNQKIKKIYCELQKVVIHTEFRQNDILVLLRVKNLKSKEQLDKLTLFLNNQEYQQFQIQQSSQTQLIPTKTQSILRLNRQISHKSEANLLLNNDIQLEGYLKRKKTDIHDPSQYSQQYFRLTSQCLLWYSNPNSQALVDRIFLSDIKQVYLHPKSPSKFFIDLKNSIRHKFKTSSIDTAIKWVQHINLSSFKPKQLNMKPYQLKNIPQQQIFNNYFQQIQKGEESSRVSNMRDYKPSKLTTQESSSVSPVKKSNKSPEGKKRFGLNKIFGCR